MNVDKIIRSQRKSISIEVKKDGLVILRAPLKASEKQINDAIAKYSSWITKKKELVNEQISKIASKEYVDGEKFLFLGNWHELKIADNSKNAFRFDGKDFYIDSAYLIHSKQIFENFYRISAKKIIPPRVAEFARIIEVDFNRIRITAADTRWGSCSGKRNLNFSWKLIMAPTKVIDYVIVHEIAHLFEMNHSKRFWDIVEKLFPDYKVYRTWLKENAHQMVY
jgi:predicted metal-dependent hydrolase